MKITFSKMEGANHEGGKEADIFKGGAHIGYLRSQTAREGIYGFVGSWFVECYMVEVYAPNGDEIIQIFWVKDFTSARAALKAARDWARANALPSMSSAA